MVDDTHLKITLAEPFAGYIYQLATPSCSILSEKCVTEAGDDFGIVAEKTIGSGPYMVTKYTDDLVRLERNPYYQGEDYSVKKLELYYMDPALMDEAFQNGEIDILDANNIPAYTLKKEYKAENWKDRLVTKNCVEVHFLMLNVDTFPLDDVRVRRAIQLAIDRKEILHDIYDKEGTTTDGIYPKGLNGYTEENQGWLEHDPKEAARLIKEAGLDETVRIELAANASASTTDLNTLNMIRDDLQEIGLEVSVVNYDYDSWLYLRGSGKLMAYKGKWFADYNDPDNFIYTFFGNQDKTTFRSGNYNNEEIFDRIANARTIQDQDQRLAEYADLEKILVQDEAVWVPLFSTNHLFVLGDRVESFEPYWAGWSTMDLRDVILK